MLVSLRLTNYASSGDSWAEQAARLSKAVVEEAQSNGGLAPALTATYERFSKYCRAGEEMLAWLQLGEWIGLALRSEQ